jgi:branched-chain amino acid transport system substrate-binding protein
MVWFLAGLAAIAGIAAWSGGPVRAEPPDGTIKIGAFLSLTGPGAYLGEPQDKTLQLDVADINIKGGLLGRRLQLIVYDDGGDPAKARSFGRRLIAEDRVDIVIGGTLTGTTLAVMPLVEQAQIPMVALGGAVTIVEPTRKWVFKTSYTDRMACEKIMADLAARGLLRIALLSASEPFGRSMHDQCLGVAGRFHVDIVAAATYGAEDMDLTVQFSEIAASSNVQALVDAGFGQGAITVLRAYRQREMTLPFYESHGAASDQLLSMAGSAAEGMRLTAPPLLIASLLPDDDPQKPVLLAYRQRYTKRWNQPASPFGGYAHDAMTIIAEAIRRAGSIDPVKVRDEIEKTHGLVDTAGTVTMSPTDHLGLTASAFRLLEVKNGAWTLVR